MIRTTKSCTAFFKQLSKLTTRLQEANWQLWRKGRGERIVLQKLEYRPQKEGVRRHGKNVFKYTKKLLFSTILSGYINSK